MAAASHRASAGPAATRASSRDLEPAASRSDRLACHHARMPLRSVVPVTVLALAIVLPSAPAHAAPSSGAAGAKVRVHVDTDFFGFTHYDPESSDNPSANVNTLGFGVGRLSLIDGGTALFDRPLIAFGAGAVILGGRAVVGARAAFVVDGFLRDDSNDTAVGGRLVPYFNYIFNQRGRVRPYIGLRFGLGGGSLTTEGEFGGAPTRDRISVIYPIVGAQGGVHVFLADRVSLDPGLAFDYAAPFGKTQRLEPDNGVDTELELAGHVLNAALTLGLSMWF